MFDVIKYDGYLVDALRILDMGNGGYSTSFNMKDSWWILHWGNGGYLTSSDMTDTWWIRYGYLIEEMVDI